MIEMLLLIIKNDDNSQDVNKIDRNNMADCVYPKNKKLNWQL